MLFELVEQEKEILTVSDLTRQIKGSLESTFATVNVEGEISNFRPSAAGHWYFSLKDEHAVISCVMFRGKSLRVPFAPEDGMSVHVRGRISVYEKRGNYQIICDAMDRSGEGAILAMLEERKRKFAAQGLFDADRKQAIPPYPSRVAVVTSPTGAALRDILQVLGRRGAGIDVRILPSLVQGENAGKKIAEQIRRANSYQMADVLIIGRGGGSLEDLLPFSEELVVEAIAESKIPVISAVGHQTDSSLSDYAADLSAPTPSAAAELVCSEREALLLRVKAIEGEIENNIRRSAEHGRLLLERFSRSQMIERMELLLQPHRLRLDDLREEMERKIKERCKEQRHRLTLLQQRVEGASPQAILDKGYALIYRADDDHPISSVQQGNRGDILKIQMKDGRLEAEIQGKEETDEKL